MSALYVQDPLTPAAAGQPECVLPGCTEPAPAYGTPCSSCRTAFGSWLAETDRPAPTQDEVAARDEAVREQYRAQLATAAVPPFELERKRNQTCWMCEEKHTCTPVAGRWECDTCREVQ